MPWRPDRIKEFNLEDYVYNYRKGGSKRMEEIKPRGIMHQELIEEIEQILEELKSSKYIAVKKFKRGKEMVGSAPTRSLDIVYIKGLSR